ncbi:glyoxalase superfamily protein [Micromonospora zamorensis]|uniref:glyoxalase superfamily protein n=1 Tax=Micromonospora zamorensis TaxID=709883 RepID=UPI0033F71EEC
MTERLAPVLRTTDANAAATWYARLGFVKQWEHRFASDLPLYVSIARGDVEIHLSEHTGDAARHPVVSVRRRHRCCGGCLRRGCRRTERLGT